MATLSVLIGGDDRELQAALRRAQSGMRRLGREFRSGVNDAAKYAAAMAAVGGAIAVHMVRTQLDAVDALAKTADKLGVTTEGLATMRRAADLSGVEARTLDMALQRMTRRLSEAAAGTGEAKGALKELGLDARALAAMAPDQAFMKIAEAMSGVATQGDRVRLAFKLFDSEGVALVNTLALGSEGLDRAREEADLFGQALSRIDAAKIEQANDSMSAINLAVDGFWKQMTVKVAPILKQFAEDFKLAAKEAGGMEAIATKAFNKVVVAAGFLMDAMDGVRRVFIILADAVVAAMATAEIAVRGFIDVQFWAMQRLTLGLSSTINKWREENRQAMSETAGVIGHAWDNIQETLMEPLPSQGLQDFIDKAQKAGETAAKAAADARGRGAGDAPDAPGGARNDELQKRLDNLRKEFASEDEILFQRREKQLEDIKEFEEAKRITQEEADLLREEVEQTHWERIGEIRQRAADKALAIERAKNDALARAQADFFSNLAGLMNTESKRVFEFGKKAAIFQALIKTKQAVVDAWQAGMSVGGPWAPVVAAAYASAAALNGANLINNIRSQQFGGGGGAPIAPTQGASGVTGEGAAAVGAGGAGGPTTIIQLHGDTFGRDQVRDLLSRLNEERRDGGRFIFS